MAKSFSCHLTSSIRALQTATILFLSVMTQIAPRPVNMPQNLLETEIALRDLKHRVNDAYKLMANADHLINGVDPDIDTPAEYAQVIITEDQYYQDLNLPKEFQAPDLKKLGLTQPAINNYYEKLNQFTREYSVVITNLITIETARLHTSASTSSCNKNLSSHVMLCELERISHRMKSLVKTVPTLTATPTPSCVTSDLPDHRDLRKQYFVAALHRLKSQVTAFYKSVKNL